MSICKISNNRSSQDLSRPTKTPWLATRTAKTSSKISTSSLNCSRTTAISLSSLRILLTTNLIFIIFYKIWSRNHNSKASVATLKINSSSKLSSKSWVLLLRKRRRAQTRSSSSWLSSSTRAKTVTLKTCKLTDHFQILIKLTKISNHHLSSLTITTLWCKRQAVFLYLRELWLLRVSLFRTQRLKWLNL